MLASRLAGILPLLDVDEALESSAVRSVAGLLVDVAQFRVRPTRAPHHSASAAALIGGGSIPRPGEVSLAHHGVLFLDELPEFDRHVLENLREPLESGRVLISRAARQSEFPARFQLVAAMNPCPCGHLGDPSGRCRCTPDAVSRYAARISGPLLDRIDIHIEVPRVAYDKLSDQRLGEPSAAIQARVEAARQRQRDRFDTGATHLQSALHLVTCNADMRPAEVRKFCDLDDTGRSLMKTAMSQLQLSARAYHRLLKLARTIADLAGSETIQPSHLAEALQYRPKHLV
jgi:magnesium chelatase family protein